MSLDAGTSGLQWIISGYALVFGVLLVPAGRAGDVWGRGRLFVTGLVVFGAGALLAGLAQGIVGLNLARLVMGVGSGLLNPQVSGMIQQFFRGEARGRAFGALGSVVGVSVAIGPILAGGLITLLGSEWGWRASFLVFVPIAAGGVIAARRLLPDAAWRGNPRSGRADFDPVGMVLLALTTASLMIPFMEARTAGPLVWLLLPTGLGIGALWVAWERSYARRGHAPVVNLALFRTSSFANGTAVLGFYFIGSASVFVLIAQYMQLGLGHNAFVAGLTGLPYAICSAISALIAGRRIVRVGRPLVLLGMGFVVLGLTASAAVALLHSRGVSEWWLLVTLGIVGIGQGMVVSPNHTLTLAEVPVEYAGSAGGVLQTGQRLGTAVGIATVTTLAFVVAGARGWDFGLAAGLGGIVLATLLAATFGVRDWRDARLTGRNAAGH